jgi:hypothetical protein
MNNEIILYQPDEKSSRLEVRLENETVWLTQIQMSELFQTSRNNITLHIGNIFKEKELTENSVCKDSLLTATVRKFRTVENIVLPDFSHFARYFISLFNNQKLIRI